jgi:hypothetical protein
LAVCLVAWCSWLFRYDIRPGSSQFPFVYLLDRWTGSTYFSRVGGVWEKIEFEKKLKTEDEGSPATGRGFIPLDEAPPTMKSWGEGAPVKK